MINKIKTLIKNNDEIVKYLIFGFLTTLISLVTYYIMTLFLDVKNPFLLQVCNVTSWIISVLFAFFTNRAFVFKSKKKNKLTEFIKFSMGRIFTLAVDMLGMFIFVSVLNFNDKIIKLILQVVIIILNYVISKFFVFKKNAKDEKIDFKLLIKNNTFNIIFFLIFLLILSLSPISGDDFGNYNASGTLLRNIEMTIGLYKTWEGRIVSRFLIFELIKQKFIWNILTSLLITLMYDSLMKLINTKNKSTYLLMMLGILLVNINLFSQTYTWVSGSITYLYPTALTIIYYSYLYRTKDKKKNVFEIIILCLTNIITPMFVENIGCAFVFGNILYIIYLIINKYKYKLNILYSILSITSLVSMLLSPGSASRAMDDKMFSSLSIFGKVFYNISNFISFGITKNYFMMFLIVVCLNIFIFKKLKFRKLFRVLIILLFDIIPILSIVQKGFNISFISGYIPKFLKYSTTNKIFMIYWAFFLLLLLYNLYDVCKKDKKDLIHILLMLVGLSSILSMLVVCVWGERIAILEVIVLTFIAVKILDSYINDKKFIKFMIPISSLVVCSLLLIFIFCYRINKYRIDYINEQIKENKEEIVIINNPIKFIWNNNIGGDYFITTYKIYVGIANDKNIKVEKLSLREYIDIVF